MKEAQKTKEELIEEIVKLQRQNASLQESYLKFLEESAKKEYALQQTESRNALLLDLFTRAPLLTDMELYQQALDIAVQMTGSAIGFFHQVSENQQLMNAITRAANNYEPLEKIVDLIANQFRNTFNSHMISVFIPDDRKPGLHMYGNQPDHALVQKIEELTGILIPPLVLKTDGEHPFSEIGKSRKGQIYAGKGAICQRLGGYLAGTSWPADIKQATEKIIPELCDLMDYQSSAAVPLICNSEIAGFMEIGSRDLLTEHDLRRIQSLADHLAAVITRYDSDKKLRESEARMSSAFDYAAIGMAFVGTDGRWLRVNAAVPAMLGYSEMELLSKTFQEITHPDDLNLDMEFVRQMLEGTIRTYQMEKRYFHKKGHIIWVMLSVSLVHDQDGMPLHFISQIQDITDRKNAENALKEVLEKLNQANVNLEKRVEERTREILEISGFHKTILANAPIAVMTSDPAGIFQSINPAGERMLGYSSAEIVGKRSPLFLHDREEIVDVCRKITAIDDPADELIRTTIREFMGHRTTEWIYVRKNGEKFPVRITHSPIIDDNGVLLGYMGLIIDITQERAAIESLRESEERFHNMFHDHAAIMMLIDPSSGEIIEANKSAERFYGYPFNTLSGFSVTNINALPSDQLQIEMIQAATRQQNIFIFSHKLASGEIRTVEVHSTPIGVRGKKVLFSIIHDITERALAEQALKKSEAENRAIVQAVPDLMFRLRRDGTFLEVISKNVPLFLPDEADFIGKTIPEILPPELAVESMWSLGQAFETGQVEQYEYTLPTEGTTRYYENRIIAISKEEALSIIRDITRRREIQNELEEAKNEAEKANLAKSEFLSRMSHELRTPMNSILGFAQLLDMGATNPREKKGIMHILTNGKHLLDLINEVLDISGIETGSQKLVTEPVALAPVIQEVTDSIQGAANQRNVTVEFADPFSGRLYVTAHRIRLKQILINLLGNAIKYNFDGGKVRIHTDIQPSGKNGEQYVRISVSDTGIGIKPEDISKLFQPFERIGADKTDTEGTGLGLMMVKKLTEAMGGTVGIESEYGVGSTFWFELPVHQGEVPDAGSRNVAPAGKVTENNKVSAILYVEDNLSNIELVEDILATHRPGLHLLTTQEGSQATGLAAEYKPALILLDLDLPDIQGAEVLERLRADTRTNSIPVAVVSADAMPFQLKRLMEAGACEYLTKPLDIVHFLKTIDKYL